MTGLLLALLCGQELQDLVERALAEENRDARRAAVGALRAFPFRDLEQAVRKAKRGSAPFEAGKVVERDRGDELRYALHVPAAYDPARPAHFAVLNALRDLQRDLNIDPDRTRSTGGSCTTGS